MNSNNKLSIFGSSGFIGNRFCKLYPEQTIKIPREVNTPETTNILYLISTIDNYNIHKDLQIDIQTNLLKFIDVLSTIKDKKNTVINFVSSWFVYGQNNEVPFKEDISLCKPTGFYSITKLCAEQLLISFCKTFDIKYRIFRLANILGETDKKISKQKNALQFLIREVVYGRDIPLYYGGDVLRDYMYVDDACDAIMFCIKNAPLNEIINIGNGKPLHFKTLIEKAIKESNSKSNIINIEPTNFHNIVQVRHSYLDITKLNNIGFTSKYDIDIVIKKLVNYYTTEKTKI
jgi:nucleoside-diphosphate-sugar epimerase